MILCAAFVQDVVARRGKLLFMYKRPGHRVIINSRGDLIVRPSYAEASVQRVPGGEHALVLSMLKTAIWFVYMLGTFSHL